MLNFPKTSNTNTRYMFSQERTVGKGKKKEISKNTVFKINKKSFFCFVVLLFFVLTLI